MTVVRTDVRSRDYQISRMGRLPDFLKYGATLARARRGPLQMTQKKTGHFEYWGFSYTVSNDIRNLNNLFKIIFSLIQNG